MVIRRPCLPVAGPVPNAPTAATQGPGGLSAGEVRGFLSIGVPASKLDAMGLRTAALLSALTVGLWGAAPSLARADIYECRTGGGGVNYTNSPGGAKGCRLIVRGSRGGARRSANVSAATTTFRAPRTKNEATLLSYEPHIREAARLYQLPEAFIRAVVHVESNYNAEVISRAGAMGLMQLMPATARSMGVSDAFNARQNILGGTRFLRILANKFNGDLVLTVAAYNAGEGAVIKYRGVPPYEETRRYVRRVLTHYYSYRLDEPGARAAAR